MNKSEFRNNVKDLLNHLSDTAYLENSNLVNLFLSEEEARQTNRLQLLRNRISASIELLRPPQEIPDNVAEWRCYRILTMRYLRGMELYRIESELGLSQRQVQRDLKKGVDALTSILWDQLPAAEKEASPVEALQEEAPDSYDLELIQKELMGWEMTFDFFNLCEIIEQALQLSESLLETDMHRQVDYADVDEHLSVHVDQILTKQGLYKILGMVGGEARDARIQIRSRKLNDYFIELSIQFDHNGALNLGNWQIAQLFFTIQGVNHSLTESPGQTTVSIVLPLTRQNSCLVIDDVVSVRRLVERMLGSYGIQVFGTDDGQQAMGLALLMKPDFILLDILMPKIDGWQMMKEIG